MRTTLRRPAKLLAVLTASVAALLLSTTAASAATTNSGFCGGSRSLTVHAGPGDQNIEVIERATAGSGNILGVTSGFTWRNLNTGATGGVGQATERPNTHSWERSWIVRTGRGTVSASWNSFANQTNGCMVVSTLEARGDTR